MLSVRYVLLCLLVLLHRCALVPALFTLSMFSTAFFISSYFHPVHRHFHGSVSRCDLCRRDMPL